MAREGHRATLCLLSLFLGEQGAAAIDHGLLMKPGVSERGRPARQCSKPEKEGNTSPGHRGARSVAAHGKERVVVWGREADILLAWPPPPGSAAEMPPRVPVPHLHLSSQEGRNDGHIWDHSRTSTRKTRLLKSSRSLSSKGHRPCGSALLSPHNGPWETCETK